MTSFLSNEYAKLHLYSNQLLWLYRASYRINKNKIFKLIILSGLGILLQILFFLGFIFYINNDQILIYAYFSYDFTKSLIEVFIASCIFLGFFFLGALSQYRAEALSLDISFSYEKHIKHCFLSDLKSIEGLHQFSEKYGIPVLKIFNADTRAACRVLRVSSNLIIPAILLFFGSLGLAIYAPFLTSIFLLIALVFIFVQKKISKEVSISSRNLESDAIIFSRLAKQALQSENKRDSIIKKSNLSFTLVGSEAWKDFYRHSEQRILGQFKSVFVSNIFFILTLCVGGLYFYGLWLENSNFNLGVLVSLLVFARVFLGGVKTIFSRLAVVSRFHHGLSRHIEVVDSVFDPIWRELNLGRIVALNGLAGLLDEVSIDDNEDDEI